MFFYLRACARARAKGFRWVNRYISLIRDKLNGFDRRIDAKMAHTGSMLAMRKSRKYVTAGIYVARAPRDKNSRGERKTRTIPDATRSVRARARRFTKNECRYVRSVGARVMLKCSSIRDERKRRLAARLKFDSGLKKRERI